MMDRLGDSEDGQSVTAELVRAFVVLPSSECTVYHMYDMYTYVTHTHAVQDVFCIRCDCLS